MQSYSKLINKCNKIPGEKSWRLRGNRLANSQVHMGADTVGLMRKLEKERSKKGVALPDNLYI